MTTVARSLERIAESYRVPPGKKFRLASCDPADDGGLDISKKKANALLAEGVEKLADLQSRLYAQDRCRCSSSSRRWTPPARTARSSTSCRESTLRVARSLRSRRLLRWSSTT